MPKRFKVLRAGGQTELLHDFEEQVKEQEKVGYCLHSWNYMPWTAGSTSLAIVAIYELAPVPLAVDS